MIAVHDYRLLRKLYESTYTEVYRGLRISDSQPVILKIMKESGATTAESTRYLREFELLRGLDLKGVIKAYDFGQYDRKTTLVLEDFGGISLNVLRRDWSLSLPDLLSLVIQVVEILGQLHEIKIIHKAINPSNILFRPTTNQLKVIDFGIATELSRESLGFGNPKLLGGLLKYISPEQSGRMNRAIDYRTDFYSLGVTFYELLTGRLPFQTDDILELVHCHLAQKPVPPREVRPELPSLISDIILRLMAKNAEDRYQSAYGIRADLQKCLNQLSSKGKIGSFQIGKQDLRDRFQIPQKLYGRKQVVQILLNGFDRVSQGAAEIMLVAGYSGVGKTALVQEIHKPITQRRGYFISVKFDQYKRDIPYHALTDAFRSLMRMLLTETKTHIDQWRKEILFAVSSNGQIIIEVIPELELIIGKQSLVPKSSPTEMRSRFEVTFQNFVGALASKAHPLVIFVDDLQWIDGASLKLIECLMNAKNSAYLYFLAAYRKEEITEESPLLGTLERIRKTGLRINEVHLSDLSLADVTQLIHDTLHYNLASPDIDKDLVALSKLVLNKTGGNPYFLSEFLRSLYTEKLISFDKRDKKWKWDLNKIKARQFTDNVVSLMAEKVKKLPTNTQIVLKLAACIGNRFDLRTLAMVSERSSREIATDLWTAIDQNFVSLSSGYFAFMKAATNSGLAQAKLKTEKHPIAMELRIAHGSLAIDQKQGTKDPINLHGDFEGQKIEFKFVHDRVRQAIHSLIPMDERQFMHHQIGQFLLKQWSPDIGNKHIFQIVNQLNQGILLCINQIQRSELATLNLAAGRAAKASVAFEPALDYLQTGIGLLAPGEQSWVDQYELALELYNEAGEAAYLCGQFEEMERLTSIVVERANTILDSVKIYEIKIQAYLAQGKLRKVITTALPILKLLEVELPEKPQEQDVLSGFNETRSILAGYEIEELGNLREMTDPSKLAAMRILLKALPAAYFAVPSLYALITIERVILSVRHGNAGYLSAHAYASYGGILCRQFWDIESGSRFGQLALSLVEKFKVKEYKTKILFVVDFFIRHWKKHVKETLKPMLIACQRAQETGDLLYAAYTAYFYCRNSFFIGKDLAVLEQEMVKYSRMIAKTKQQHAFDWNEMQRQAALNLLGQSENTAGSPPCNLIGEAYDETKLLPALLQVDDKAMICSLFLHKLILNYLFRNKPQAVRNAVLAERYLEGANGTICIPIFLFYDSLARLAMYRITKKSDQKRTRLRKVAANQKKMKDWVKYATANHSHKFCLVEAERARVMGNDGKARELYDQAIHLAREQEYVNEEALACELACEFYLSKGLSKIAQVYLDEAYSAYKRWGAKAKIRDLDSRYPHLVRGAHPGRSDKASVLTSQIGTVKPSFVMDLASVFKASQTISGEIVLDILLKKMIEIVMENLGAEAGCLILKFGDSFLVKVKGWLDIGKGSRSVLSSIPVDEADDIAISVVYYVIRTQETIVVDNAASEGQFSSDPYIKARHVKSLLVAPVINQGKLKGVIHLQNNLIDGAFTPDRLEVFKFLSSQIAISIENAQLYSQLEEYNRNLEKKVTERTWELSQTVDNLKVAEENLKAAVAQAETANRAKSEFLASMSHEFRTPLNAILGFAQIFQADLSLKGVHKKGIHIIESSGNHLLTLINDILDLSKIEARKFEIQPNQFLLSKFLHEVVGIGQIRAEQKGLSFYFNPMPSLPLAVLGDEKRLKQVLVNLLGNAVKFTDKGHVTLRVLHEESGVRGKEASNGNREARDEPQMLDSRCHGKKIKNLNIKKVSQIEKKKSIQVAGLEGHVEHQNSWKLCFQVEDTGTGISTDEIGKIFAPFHQISEKNHVEGTGLGLAISKKLVDMMGGKLEVQSTLGKGSKFSIRLELPEGDCSKIIDIEPVRRVVSYKGSPKKILIVDDKLENRSLIKNILIPLGFTVEEADGGSACIKKANSTKPDLILMDLIMPQMDGFETSRRIRRSKALKNTPIIAVSARVFEENRLASREAGCNDFVSKPIRVPELLEKIGRSLNLVWINELEKNTEPKPDLEKLPLIIPPPELLNPMLEHARKGEIVVVREQITQIKQSDTRYIPFTSKLSHFASDFDMKGLCEFIESYISGSSRGSIKS